MVITGIECLAYGLGHLFPLFILRRSFFNNPITDIQHAVIVELLFDIRKQGPLPLCWSGLFCGEFTTSFCVGEAGTTGGVGGTFTCRLMMLVASA